jgi:type IV pilus assembly protein PilM
MPRARTAGRTIVGLDIEPGFVAAVQARTAGAGPGDRVVIERAAGVPLGPGIVRDGEVADPEALAEALRELFRQHKLGRRVRIGVANQRIVVRTVDLPPLQDAKEIAAAVRFHAQDHIPMPLEHAVLEHQSLGLVDTADGQRTRVVLVAARRDMIERLHAAARQAGLRPAGIDLAAFAMIRALHRADVDEGATLYVSIGGVTNLALAEGTTCIFTRVAPGGVEALAAELAERRGLTLEHARQWLAHVGLIAPVETLTGDGEIVEEARSVLVEGVRRIADEVRNSLDFYRAQAGALAAERAVVTGPAVAIPGFCERLGTAIGLPVEVGSVAEARDGAYGGIEGGRLAVAAGLALDEAPRSATRVRVASAAPAAEPANAAPTAERVAKPASAAPTVAPASAMPTVQLAPEPAGAASATRPAFEPSSAAPADQPAVASPGAAPATEPPPGPWGASTPDAADAEDPAAR